MDLEDYKIFKKQGKDYWWFKGKRDLLNRLLNDIKLNKNRSKILDVGCGVGEDLNVINKYGDVYAIEYSKDAIKLVNRKLVKGLFCNDAAKLCFKDKTFDCVIVLDVLEHLDNDKDAYREALRVLKRNSYLIISVPAMKFLFGPHDRRLKHRRRYSRKMLKDLINDSNLKIIKFTYWNSFLFLPIALIRLYKKMFNIKKSDLTEFNKNINFVLTKTLIFENKLIKKGFKFPFGLSLIAVLKKIR